LTTDAIDLGFFEPVEQIGKIGIGLAGKPTMKVERSVSSDIPRATS
jgi:hypothetical protein